ncbi:MAG: antibiotic biosynthesis monooxygenase [Bacteroidia bacterium]|nr:antibiotic biosynthesis monooxygenase [Bacteroidia bacterium]
MINRIVRMSFEPEKVEEFLAVFENVKNQIADFEGCEGLILLRDAQQFNVLFTYSYWLTPDALNKYRFSALFKKTWGQTTKLFNDKPMAWSLIVEQVIK